MFGFFRFDRNDSEAKVEPSRRPGRIELLLQPSPGTPFARALRQAGRERSICRHPAVIRDSLLQPVCSQQELEPR